MSSAIIMESVLTKIKMVLSEKEELLASAVAPEASEAVNRLLGGSDVGRLDGGSAKMVGDSGN